MNNDNGSVSYAVTLDHKQMNRDKQDVVNIFHEIGQEAQQQGEVVDNSFNSAAKNIGKALRALRSQKGISQEKLALETGIGRRYMSDIENGRRNVSLEIIEKLADFFEMSSSDLVKEIENAAFPPLTQKSLKRWLVEHDYNDSVIFQNPDYMSAVVGVSEEGRVIYSYEKMVWALMMTDGMDYEEAVECVDFNTIGALPTMGENAPIIMYEVEG